MDSIIETQRQTHEELERYEEALSSVLMQNPTAQRNITRRDRKAAEILDRIVSLRADLVTQYEDLPILRPKELALLSAPPVGSGQDDLEEFYKRFGKVKEFHRKNTGINVRGFINELEEMVRSDGLQSLQVDEEEEAVVIDPLDSVFSGEEAYGKHLDLYLPHSQYLNLRGANRVSYVAFLDMLRHGKLERTLDVKDKSLPAYTEYAQTLYTYLVSFFERALPLINIRQRIQDATEDFETAWEAGRVEGWDEGSSKPVIKAVQVNGAGIWCQYCQKHYSKQTVYDSHLKSDKHQKRVKEGTTHPDPSKSSNDLAPNPTQNASSSTSLAKLKPQARLTYLSSALLLHAPIPQLLADSRGEVERRMALTSREREAELEEAEEAPPPPPEITTTGEEDDEDEDGKIYNPLKLPLGWDGKPIPYWLYKLHGLGVSFACEICSESSYQGRKAFDRHFQESRHAFGMRALGLPNTKHFHGITGIKEALALAEKLKHEGRQEISALEKAEEFEDSEGNVYDRRTYEDLKKQGMI